MAKIAFVFGILLIVLGVGGYFAASVGSRSPTAFIPAIAGVLLIGCGALALQPKFRMHAMHAAATIGLLGFIAPLGRVIPKAIQGSPPHGLALFSQLMMAALCLAFVLLCVRSFIAARRAREQLPS